MVAKAKNGKPSEIDPAVTTVVGDDQAYPEIRVLVDATEEPMGVQAMADTLVAAIDGALASDAEIQDEHEANLKVIYAAAEKVADRAQAMSFALGELEEAKGAHKAAVESWKASVERQQQIIEECRQSKSAGPLFEKAKVVEVVADEPWRATRLDELTIPEKYIKALAAVGIHTVGQIAKHTDGGKSLQGIPGIGETGAVGIAEVLGVFHAVRIIRETRAAKPDALPNVPAIDWRTIRLSAVLSKHPEIAAKLADRHGIATLGDVHSCLTAEGLTLDGLDIDDAQLDTLADVLDRKRRDSDGFAAAVSREMLGFEPEPVEPPKPAKKTRKAAQTPAEGPVAASA